MKLVLCLAVLLLLVNLLYIQGKNVYIPNKNLTVTETQSVTLYCNTSQLTNASVTWVKGDDRDNILSRNNNLKFIGILRTNTGRYICNATNGTSHFTDETYISVQYPPSIILTGAPVVLENKSMSLICNTTGNPTPMVEFTKDGRTLKKNQKQAIIEFQPVSRDDSGLYKCTASNDVGNKTATLYFDVQYPPEITITNLSPISSWLGFSVRITCNVTANPAPKVTWYKSNTVITSSNELVVNITSVTQFGTYRCIANNSRGEDSWNVTLKRTRFPPDGPTITNNVTNIKSRNFTLKWTKPNDNGSPINTYFVFKQQIYNNGSKDNWKRLAVSPTTMEQRFLLDWGASYRFYISARNGQGERKGDVKNFTVIEEPRTPLSPQQNKFLIIGACVGGGGLLLLVIIIVTICCCRRRSKNLPQSCPKQSPLKQSSNFSHSILMEELTARTPEVQHTSGRYKMSKKKWGQNHTNSSELQQAPSENTAVIYDNIGFVDKSVASWEIPRENVTIEKVIGKGAFCQVAKAFTKGLGTVAVKMIRTKGKQASNREDLLAEYKLLQNLGTHDNVIMVMGGVTISDPIMVLFEYVPYGDLLGYLRRSRGLTDTYYTDPDYQPSSTLTSKQLLRFAREIADGMAFISSKKIIHRDLAARNVLVGEGETCKITDFGMARDVKNDDIYQKKTRGRLPVKWTAYEALLYGYYSTESDMFSTRWSNYYKQRY